MSDWSLSVIEASVECRAAWQDDVDNQWVSSGQSGLEPHLKKSGFDLAFYYSFIPPTRGGTAAVLLEFNSLWQDTARKISLRWLLAEAFRSI